MKNKRLDILRLLMKEKNIEAVLLKGDVNRNYITRFTGDESFALITSDKAFFITDSRYTEQARLEVVDFDILQYTRPFTSYLNNLLKDNNISELFFEENILTYSTYKMFEKELQVKLLPLNGLVEEMRLVKDEEEINNIRTAATFADEAFSHILNFIKPGVKERDVAIELEFFLKKKGASALSFDTIVASGYRSALPHGVASDKVINSGDLVTLDFGCIYQGYCSDMTRTVAVGNVDDKLLEIYKIVLNAQSEALKNFAPLKKCSELDKIARDIIEKAGYGTYFGHGLGHGVGREIHEAPAVSGKNDSILKSGYIVTNEPGIYIPGLGGVRIEDLLLITKDGYEVLSHSSKELIIL
ncbi:MAG: M24 family metallopeptidase [Clostridiaceae bacterium]